MNKLSLSITERPPAACPPARQDIVAAGHPPAGLPARLHARPPACTPAGLYACTPARLYARPPVGQPVHSTASLHASQPARLTAGLHASTPARPPAHLTACVGAPDRLRRRACRPRRQRGLALITVLLVMTSVTLLGLAMQELVDSNIRLSGAQYQVRVARAASATVMNVFRQLGRPRLAQLVPTTFTPSINRDLGSVADLNADINTALAQVSAGTGGLVASQNFIFDPANPSIIRADYLGRSRVPPGNEAAELFPATINSTEFCADFFRLVASATTTGGARGAVDQNMYIVSPCGNN